MQYLNPAYKCLTIIICGILLSLTYHIYFNLTVFVVALILLLLAKANLKKLFIILFWVSLAAAGFFTAGFFFSSAPETSISTSLNQAVMMPVSVQSGLQLATRIYAFAGLGLLFALTTNMQQFVYSLEQQFRLPSKFAYGILAALNLAPLLPYEYKKSVHALQARGRLAFPLSLHILTPLMVKSIRWSESLAIAMESKGFDENSPRTHFVIMKVRWFDYLFMVLSTLIFMTALIFL
ncbi:energy-coupling factor transporter transmembrane component T family protein [Zophobihabitans entericus]|uniref:Energy-coupling factor transporter transmembrane protein EcfT n=1 Tax=Zophobihabitans entericus TaxID=1635327 RepID=A0A6G9ICY9_9GAMM|nr:energy-coupling factor transporter transmembrane component T [Zophobihabitans entericus]QIQ21707.1 energy-coupling factor transporter transmembrane protein EcfT [Zophobihabitans entericus]